MAAVILRVAGADSASGTALTTAAHSGVRSPARTPAPPNVLSSSTARSSNTGARAVIVGGTGAGPGLDPGGQRGQVAQVPAGRRGGDQDRIGSVPAFPGAGRSSRRWCGRGDSGRSAAASAAATRGSAGQLDLRHLAHLAGVA